MLTQKERVWGVHVYLEGYLEKERRERLRKEGKGDQSWKALESFGTSPRLSLSLMLIFKSHYHAHIIISLLFYPLLHWSMSEGVMGESLSLSSIVLVVLSALQAGTAPGHGARPDAPSAALLWLLACLSDKASYGQSSHIVTHGNWHAHAHTNACTHTLHTHIHQQQISHIYTPTLI